MKSRQEWEAWGRLDPLYAVATVDGKARGESEPWDDAAFFDSGAAAWSVFREHWQRYGLSRTACVEIGCGAGRMTRSLAHDFDLVYAVDISAEMIAYAKRTVPGDVRFILSDGLSLPLADRSVDAAFSTHVFQHLDNTRDGITYFREVHRVLAPGGSMMIHLPVIVWPGGSTRRLHDAIDKAKARVGESRAALRRRSFQLGLRKKPIMRMTYHEIDALQAGLASVGFSDIELTVICTPALGHPRHTFVLARRGP